MINVIHNMLDPLLKLGLAHPVPGIILCWIGTVIGLFLLKKINSQPKPHLLNYQKGLNSPYVVWSANICSKILLIPLLAVLPLVFKIWMFAKKITEVK